MGEKIGEMLVELWTWTLADRISNGGAKNFNVFFLLFCTFWDGFFSFPNTRYPAGLVTRVQGG